MESEGVLRKNELYKGEFRKWESGKNPLKNYRPVYIEEHVGRTELFFHPIPPPRPTSEGNRRMDFEEMEAQIDIGTFRGINETAESARTF